MKNEEKSFSRFFIKSDPIIKNFTYKNINMEFYENGWWSRIYEYKWMRDVCDCFWKKIGEFSAIDVATGDVHPGMFILKSCGFKKVIGTDLHEKEKLLYKELLCDNIIYIRDNILKTEIKEKFDCVFCISVLEHMYQNEQEIALNNLIKISKPNSYMILTFDYPGLRKKDTNLELYKHILANNKFKMKCIDVNKNEIMTSKNADIVSDRMRRLKLSCYRLFAWR